MKKTCKNMVMMATRKSYNTLYKVIIILTLSLFCSALIAGGVSADLEILTPEVLNNFSQDAGTVSSDLEIWTPEDLNNFSQKVNSGDKFIGKTVYLKSDLNLSGFDFTPIGTVTPDVCPFCGTFEGNGHTISNLNITGDDHIGLFEVTLMATINNLTLKNVSVFGNGGYVGGLIGYADGSDINNCSIRDVFVKGDGNFVGGLIGADISSHDNSQITGCSVFGQVGGNNEVGGLIGYVDGSYINNCSIRDVFVKGQNCVGGLIGVDISSHDNSQITGCSVFGQVEGNKYVGGLIGGIEASYGFEGQITDCFASCTVVGNSKYVGGLVGSSEEQVSITHSFTAGNVTGYESVGGLIGLLLNSSFESCVALNANISGEIQSTTARICGNNSGGTLSNNSAWNEMKINDQTVSGTQDDENGENVSNSDIWSKLLYWSSVVGLDISVDAPSTIWHIDVQDNPWGIPYLTSQGIPSQLEAKKIQYLKPISTLITLEKNGGTGGTDNTTATVGSSVLDPKIISPTREGHTLIGWFTEEVPVIYANGTLIPSTGYVDENGKWIYYGDNLTLYAHWKEIPQSNLYINNGVTLVPLMNVGDRVDSTSGEGYAELKDNSSDGYVLEFNNFTITNARLISPTYTSLVWSKVPLTIELNNTESDLSSDSSLRETIYCSDRLVIEGPGKLSIGGTIHGIMTNSTLSIENNAHVNTAAGVGLAATKLLITDNAKVNATGDMTSGFGIFTITGLEIVGNETVVTSSGNSSIGIKGPFTPETITIKSPLHVWDEIGDLLLNYSDANNTYSGPEFGGMTGSTFKKIEINNNEPEPVPIEPGENYLTDTDPDAASKGITAIEFNSTDIDGGYLNITPVDEHQKEIVKEILKRESKEGTILTSFDITASKGGNFTLMVSGLKEEDKDYVMTYHYSDGKWNKIIPDYHYYDRENQIGTYVFHSDSFSPFIPVIARPIVPPVPPSPHHGGGGGGTTIITSQTPMPTVTPTVTPTDNPVQPTSVSPSAVPTVPATQQQQQSPIPIIGILSGLAVGGFLLTRLRK